MKDLTTMNIKNITPRFFVSGQISATDVGIAAAQGQRASQQSEVVFLDSGDGDRR